MKSAMEWNKDHVKEWEQLKGMLCEWDSTSLSDAIELLAILYEASLYDLCYLLIELLGATYFGKEVWQQVAILAMQELWQEKVQENFITSYLTMLKKLEHRELKETRK